MIAHARRSCRSAWSSSLAAAAMVGGAAPAGEAARAVGADRRFARHLVHRRRARARPRASRPAHCVLPGADYKLVEFDAARQPTLKDVAAVARHPEFELDTLLAPSRDCRRGAAQTRRAAANVAPACSRRQPAASPGRSLRGHRRRPYQARRRQVAAASRAPPTLIATGQPGHPADPPGRSRHQGRTRPASAPAPAIPARRCSATAAARSPSSAW